MGLWSSSGSDGLKRVGLWWFLYCDCGHLDKIELARFKLGGVKFARFKMVSNGSDELDMIKFTKKSLRPYVWISKLKIWKYISKKKITKAKLNLDNPKITLKLASLGLGLRLDLYFHLYVILILDFKLKFELELQIIILRNMTKIIGTIAFFSNT